LEGSEEPRRQTVIVNLDRRSRLFEHTHQKPPHRRVCRWHKPSIRNKLPAMPPDQKKSTERLVGIRCTSPLQDKNRALKAIHRDRFNDTLRETLLPGKSIWRYPGAGRVLLENSKKTPSKLILNRKPSDSRSRGISVAPRRCTSTV